MSNNTIKTIKLGIRHDPEKPPEPNFERIEVYEFFECNGNVYQRLFDRNQQTKFNCYNVTGRCFADVRGDNPPYKLLKNVRLTYEYDE